MSLLLKIQIPSKTLDAEEKGHWITTKSGKHILIDENGNPIEGNPKVIEAMKGDKGEKEEKESKKEKPDTKEEGEEKSSTKHLEKEWQEAIEIGLRRIKENPEKFKDMRKRRDELEKKVKGKGDATYDLVTGKQVSFDKGYQVTFQTTGSEDKGNKREFISDEQYDALCAWMSSVEGSDGKAYLGYFGSAEISFRFSSKSKAKQFAKRFNQNSCWDWRTSTLVVNRFYDPKKNSVKGGEVRTDK